jgi:hypothetical protein
VGGSLDATLSGVLSGSGATTVSGGVLNLSGSLQSDVTVANSAALALSGAIGSGKSLTLASGGTLDAYAGATIAGSLTASGATINLNLPATLGSGVVLGVGGTASVGGSTINITPTGTLGDGTYTLLGSGISGGSASLISGGNSYSIYGHAMASQAGGYESREAKSGAAAGRTTRARARSPNSSWPVASRSKAACAAAA